MEPRVTLRVAEDDTGEPVARLHFPDVMFSVDPGAVAYENGILRVAVPAYINVPQSAVVVDRWLPPTAEQVRLAVEALDAAAIERVLLREQMASDGTVPWGVLARQAVAYVAAGDTGIGDD